MELRDWLLQLAASLRHAVEHGSHIDTPEGDRHIRFSATLADQLATDAERYGAELTTRANSANRNTRRHGKGHASER